ncbi:unnamed protein product [Closterium sp. NIES-54]
MATVTVVAASRDGQQQPLPHPDTLSQQQLREWVIQRGRPGGGGYRAGGVGGGGGYGFMGTGHRRQQRQQEIFSPQQLRDCVSQLGVPGCVEAFAKGASESAATLGASESPAALGGSASTATGLASAEALHTFTLDSGASRCFFRDCTTRVAICTCSLTGRHLATFTRRPGSSLYTLTSASAQVHASGQVAASSQVSASGQLAASYSCRVLSQQTLLWHHRLGHPSLPRLRSMHSRLLVSGLPRSLTPLPHSPAAPCLPCVKGRQLATPHSSSFPPTTAPL